MKHSVFLPFDGTREGFVFEYEDKVEIAIFKQAECLPSWKVGGHYAFVLEGIADGKDADIEVKNAPTSKFFQIESISEKA